MDTIVAISTNFAFAALAAVVAICGLLAVAILVGKKLRIANSASRGLPANEKVSDPDLAAQALLKKTLQLNAKLEQRLNDVESRLHEHTENISDFMTEARTDGLTGLPNRRAIDDELGRRLAAWREKGEPLYVALLDVDFFKKFNDKFGHLAGDAVLASIGRSLAHAARQGDMVGRLGGEEFAVIFAVRDEAQAILAIERIRKVIEKTEVPFEGKSLRVTASCGLAVAGAESSTSELLKHADLALYAAKADHRNCSHFYNGVRSQRITKEPCGPVSPSVTEDGAIVESRPVVRKAALSHLMAELSRDLRHKLDELTRV